MADAAASLAARRSLLDILGNARLRRRIILVLYTTCFVNMVGRVEQHFHTVNVLPVDFVSHVGCF